MKLLNSETIKALRKFLLTKAVQFKEFRAVLKICIASYSELFKNGEIQSLAIGEKVFIELKANLCGDILIFIGPNNKIKSAETDVWQLIGTDNSIEKQKQVAIKILNRKHEALLVLPILISSLVNILFITVSFMLTSNSIIPIFQTNHEIHVIKDFWPWIFPVLTFVFRKSIGHKIISFFT